MMGRGKGKLRTHAEEVDFRGADDLMGTRKKPRTLQFKNGTKRVPTSAALTGSFGSWSITPRNSPLMSI